MTCSTSTLDFTSFFLFEKNTWVKHSLKSNCNKLWHMLLFPKLATTTWGKQSLHATHGGDQKGFEISPGVNFHSKHHLHFAKSLNSWDLVHSWLSFCSGNLPSSHRATQDIPKVPSLVVPISPVTAGIFWNVSEPSPVQPPAASSVLPASLTQH